MTGTTKARSKIALVLGLILALIMSFSLAACSDITGSNGSTTSAVNTTAAPGAATTTASVPTTVAGASAEPVNLPGGSSQGGTTALQAGQGAVQPSGNLETDVKNVVKAVTPGVVLIAVNIQTSNMFGQTQQGQGVGTGSIITPDGYIVTNNHVVEGGTSIKVSMPDGRSFNARLIGRDPSNDVAVIKIDGQNNLPTVKIGDSSKLEVGDWVVAIGNALALKGGSSVTSGIVSALHRSIDEPNGAPLIELIQTDAAINPGNSGGPLLNLNGEMVGINTAVATNPEDGGAAQSIGFALSINQVKPLIDGFISGKPVTRPYLGINLVDVNPAVATRYNLPVQSGILVTQVAQGSPAAKAGWKPGDVIVAIDGAQIKDTSDLSNVLYKHQPGDTISVTLVNINNQQRTTQLTLGQRPATGG